ncbi:MAG: hypothetical protein AAGA48_12195 [Myxococcota bacterium]
MESLLELCDNILASPDEEDRWLVLGDALLDRGEPRGELILLTSAEAVRLRVRCQAPASAEKPRVLHLGSLESVVQRMRIAELTDEASWTRALRLAPSQTNWRIGWHRGAVERLSFDEASAVDVVEVLHQLEGHWAGRLCQRLRLADVASAHGAAKTLVQHAGFRRLRALSVGDGPILEELLVSASNVRELELHSFVMSESQLQRLLDAPWLDQLHALTLAVELPPGHAERVADCPRLRNLRRLDGPFKREILESSPHLSNCRFCVWMPSLLKCRQARRTSRMLAAV